MRVCLVGPAHDESGIAGVGRYLAEAGAALSAAGHEVWLIATDARGAAAGRGPFHRVLGLGAGGRPRFAFAPELFESATRVHDALRSCAAEFDYVEFTDAGASGFVALKEQQLLGTHGRAVLGIVLHGPTLDRSRANQQLHLMGPRGREACVMEDEAIRSASMLWSPSARVLDGVCARLGLDVRCGGVVHYPLSLPAVVPERRVAAGLEDLRVVFVGALEPGSGCRAVVDGFRALWPLRLEILGDDSRASPYGTSYLEWLSRGGLPSNVTVTPSPSRASLRERLCVADVCVVPPDAFELCAEAMAAGCVVVGGVDGLVEHGVTGFALGGAAAEHVESVFREDVATALPRLGDIGRAAARRARECSDPARFAARVEELVTAARGGAAARDPATGKVSIVVPFFREDPDVIGEAVDSALAQTHRDLEVVVVDDGSPRADAPAILEAMAARDPRVRVLRKPNGGLASARNFALERITGRFVLLLDADNALRPDYVSVALAVFGRHPDVAAIAPQALVFEHGTRRPMSILNGLPFDRTLTLYRNALGDAGAMFRTEVFTACGLRYDPLVDLYSDWALWLDCQREGLRVERLPRVLYDYRRHRESMMAAQAWERHLPLLGLLIERHLPPAADDRALLVTLAHAWGVGALLGSLEAHRPELHERPVETALRLRSGMLRYRVADAVAHVLGRVPGLAAVASRAVRPLVAWHGRRKDRSRGR